MTVMNKWILTILLFGLITSYAAASPPHELKVIFSSSTPPFVFQTSDAERPGILVEIVQQALAPYGYTVKPVFLPLGRGFQLLDEKKVDGISISTKKLGLKAHYSDITITYHNFAIGLASHPQDITEIADLKGRSIIAFQKARTYLGEEFASAVKGNPNYVEMADQENQVHMLLKGRIDVAVMDLSIFQFYRNKLLSEGQIPAGAEPVLYDMFPPSRYRAAFAEAEVRDRYNEGLRKLRESGAYQAIYDKYINDYFVYRD